MTSRKIVIGQAHCLQNGPPCGFLPGQVAGRRRLQSQFTGHRSIGKLSGRIFWTQHTKEIRMRGGTNLMNTAKGWFQCPVGSKLCDPSFPTRVRSSIPIALSW